MKITKRCLEKIIREEIVRESRFSPLNQIALDALTLSKSKQRIETSIDTMNSIISGMKDKILLLRNMAESTKSGQRWFAGKIAFDVFGPSKDSLRRVLETTIDNVCCEVGITHVARDKTWSTNMIRAAVFIAKRSDTTFEKWAQKAIEMIDESIAIVERVILKISMTLQDDLIPR